MTEIKIIEKNIPGFLWRCPACEKSITSLSEKQLESNAHIHLMKCKKEK